MADNLVRLVIGANDADATAHLEALKARLDEIGRKVETASVNVKGDKAAELALARIAIRLDRLNDKTSNPKIKLDGIARAMVDMEALNLQMDKLEKKAAEEGLLSRLGGGFKKLGGNIGAASGRAGIFTAKWGGLGAVLVSAAAPLAAMAAALGSFGIVAIPELKKVEAAISKTGAAGQKAWAALTPGQKDLGRSLKDLESAFHGVQRALQPVIDHTLNLAVKVGKDLMPALRTLASAGAHVLDAFLKPFDQFIKTPLFAQFVNEIARFAVQAAKAFSPILVGILTQLLKLIVQLAPAGLQLDVALLKLVATILPLIALLVRLAVPVIQALFIPAINATVKGVTTLANAILFLEDNWRTAWSAIVGALRTAWSFIDGIIHDIEGALGGLSGMIGSVSGALGGLSSAGSAIGNFIGGIFGQASGGIVGAAATGGLFSGLTLVGERGPELVRLPAGSTVYNNGQTQGMLGGGGASQVFIQINVPPGGAVLGQEFWTAFGNGIRVRGGSPQIVTKKVVFS